MKNRMFKSGLSVLIAVLLVLSNMFMPINQAHVYAAGDGTWDNPFTVAEAAAIQDNRVAAVQGYIVGQPTATNTVVTNGFPSDYALALADTAGETDISKMIYVQIPSAFRTAFGMKTNPGSMGKLIRVTGNLTAYFTHSGLKNATRMEEVNLTSVPVTGVLLDKTEASIAVGAALTLTAAIQPENASNKNVTWGSDNTAAALVDNGVVTGVAAGTATITATTEDGGLTASCIVTVTEAVDGEGPVVTSLTPAEEENTGSNFRPVIGAKYSDPSGIDLSSVKLYIDNMDVTVSAAITETEISYIPEADLAQGNHTVTLYVSDKLPVPNTTIKEWGFSVGEVSYNFYFGQLHSHTNISDGQGTLDDAYTWARDVAGADFFAVTDHSNWFDNDKLANISNGSASSEWMQLLQKADEYNNPGSFVAIGGYEMTWSGSTGGWGHINTFNTAGFETRSNSSMDLKKYYETIASQPQSISQLNHPGKTFGDFGDFGYYTPAADSVVQLVEVGNGEGVIGSSGYFPSYEYYTRALDKGWHLAPSNNQDNHLANWVTANTARTVVLAPALTRETVYDAIRKMRVYATEDSNLEIMYKANGKLMGSILTSPESLNLEISINDPDSQDVIGRVSIISNGGQVVASKYFEGNTAEWVLTMEPNNSYYYVRIDQGDADIAVTAPVWTGEVVPVGISEVTISQNPQVVGTPVEIAANVYNNGGTALPNVKVEFYQNMISDENKIGEGIIPSINAAANGSTKINWTPTATGNVNIYARMILNLGGQEKVFTGSTLLEVVNPEDVIKVVVDGGHYNQYVTGDYKNKIETLKQMLKDSKFMMVVNNDELTAADLENASILILTDPQSKDDSKYGLYRSNFTAAEISAVNDFSDNGGSIIITSRAEYNDKGAEEAYESANQGNMILEAIDSNLRFNDDEVVDYTSNGGQEYRLYFDDYTSTKYGLTDNIPAGLTYSAYSGCSVLLKDGGDDTFVDWLVMGHDTTGILDSDLQNDATPVANGDVKSLAAEILPSGSKIIVAGTTFFSDFETAAGDNAYSNKMITEKILKWLTAPPQKTIAEVRADNNLDGAADFLGRKFTVEGRVTAASKAAVTNTAFFDVLYVQDETGGITVFGVSTRAVPLGARVRITGTVDQFDGDIELQLSNENTDIEILDNSIVIVEPRTMTTADSMLESNEGLLVKVEGLVTGMTENSLFINDGTGEARVYVNGYIGDDTGNADMLGKWDSSIQIGDIVSAVGLASQDAAGHRIRVRNTAEIVKVKTPVTGIELDKQYLSLRPDTQGVLTATTIPANASDNNIVWKSSDEEVATVDANGLVTAHKTGIAKITAATADGGFTAECIAAVSENPATEVRIN
ncbi:MAG: LPXTG-motif cell wall anchor domain protein, partial [Clostridia bacterium]|nr:LPXTG-motif cell wall anchor domain protein [Clostridia bacterium]